MNTRLRKLVLSGIFGGLALIAFTIESLLPPLILPGAKFGFSNIFILLTVITCGNTYAIAVLVIKTVLGSLFTGNISAVMYSLPAGLIALIVEMLLLNLNGKISVVAVSVTGSLLNITVQNVIFCLVCKSLEYLIYLPYLSLIGIMSGVIIGFIVYLVIRYTPEKLIYKGE